MKELLFDMLVSGEITKEAAIKIAEFWQDEQIVDVEFECAENKEEAPKEDVKDTMRPIEDWLRELPEPMASKAISQIDADLTKRWGDVDNAADAVRKFTNLSKTNEGESYWSNIWCNLYTGIRTNEIIEPIALDKSRNYGK